MSLSGKLADEFELILELDLGDRLLDRCNNWLIIQIKQVRHTLLLGLLLLLGLGLLLLLLLGLFGLLLWWLAESLILVEYTGFIIVEIELSIVFSCD